MNKFKSFLFSLILIIFLGCSKDEVVDPCNEIVCNNDGVCVDGYCECPYWRVGLTCDGESRTKFFGTYIGPWRTGATPEGLIVTLSKDESNIKKILWDDTFSMVVTGGRTVDIPEQYLYAEDSMSYILFKGEGFVEKLLLTLDIYLDYGDGKGYIHTSYEGIRQE